MSTNFKKEIQKILLFFASLIIAMLVFPIMVFEFAPADSAMGWIIIMFFALYPAMSVAFGAIASFSIKRLWWFPLTFALLFPLLYSLAVHEMVWVLYVYSAIYVFLGYTAEIITYFIRRKSHEKT